MKKIILCIMTAMLLCMCVPMQLKAGVENAPVSMASTKPAEIADPNALLARLDKIKAMDRSKMSSTEKKQLRKEVRSIKKELKEMNGGVYLSVGALIIVILLLILLL